MKKLLILLLICSRWVSAENHTDMLVLENGDTLYAQLKYNWSENLVSIHREEKIKVFTPHQVRFFTLKEDSSDFYRLFKSEQDPLLGNIFVEVIISGNMSVFRKQRSEGSISEIRHYAFYQQTEIPPRYQFIVHYEGKRYATFNLKKLVKSLMGNQYSELKSRATKMKLPYSIALQNMVVVHLFNTQNRNTEEFIADMLTRL